MVCDFDKTLLKRRKKNQLQYKLLQFYSLNWHFNAKRNQFTTKVRIRTESTLNVKRCKLFSSVFIFHEKTHLVFYLLTPAHHPRFITYSKSSQLQFYDHMRNIMVIMFVRILRIRLNPYAKNPTIFNVIRWDDGMMEGSSRCLMVQCLF